MKILIISPYEPREIMKQKFVDKRREKRAGKWNFHNSFRKEIFEAFFFPFPRYDWKKDSFWGEGGRHENGKLWTQRRSLI